MKMVKRMFLTACAVVFAGVSVQSTPVDDLKIVYENVLTGQVTVAGIASKLAEAEQAVLGIVSHESGFKALFDTAVANAFESFNTHIVAVFETAHTQQNPLPIDGRARDTFTRAIQSLKVTVERACTMLSNTVKPSVVANVRETLARFDDSQRRLNIIFVAHPEQSPSFMASLFGASAMQHQTTESLSSSSSDDDDNVAAAAAGGKKQQEQAPGVGNTDADADILALQASMPSTLSTVVHYAGTAVTAALVAYCAVQLKMMTSGTL